MKHITWRKSLQACGAVLSFSVMTGLGGDMLGQRAVVVAAEDLVQDAATVEEIAKAIDLKTLPIPDGAVVTGERQLGSLNYEISGDLKPALEFQRKQLVKLGWKELPGGMTESAYCSANFQKSGFTVSVMSYAGSTPDKKSSQVFVNSLGNVNLSKLPVVKGAKSTHSTVAAVGYTTDLKAIEAGDATRKLLLDSGWESYGSQSIPPDSVVMTFKRNAIRLNVFAGAAPAQQGKVMISYSVNVMAADIPAPPNAERIGLDDTTKTLRFESSDEYDAVAKFYQQRLAKQGWKSTTGDLVTMKDDFQRPTGVLIFRNAAKDLMTLNLERINDKTHGRLSLLTAAEVVAAEKREKAAAEKFVAENKAREEAAQSKAAAKKPAMKAGAKSDTGFPDVDALIKGAVGDALKDAGLDGKKPTKPAAKVTAADKDTVSVAIPENAKKISKTSDSHMQIEFPAGKGVAATEIIRDQLLAAEWESDDSDPIKKTAGHLTFEKAGKTLVLTYVDPGFGDAKVILMCVGMKIEQAEVDPKAKAPVAGTQPKPAPKPEADAPAVAKPKPEADVPVAANANSGTFVIRGKTFKLEHVMAYESKNQEEFITILASDSKIPVDQVKKNLREKDRNDLDLFLKQTNIRFDFKRSGKPEGFRGMGDGYQFGGWGREMTGEFKLVAGRARGHVKMKTTLDDEPANCELIFDVVVGADPVQKTVAGPAEADKPKTGTAKLPADAKKLENSGTLLVNDKPVKLGNVVAYELMVSGKKKTAINFTDKPIPLPKLKALLAKDGSDLGLFDFDSQAKLEFDQKGELSVILVAHDNNSFPIIGGSNVLADVIIEDGRARGTVTLEEPKNFGGKKYSIDLTFDVEVLKLPATAKE